MTYKEIFEMTKGFDQKNKWHCYTLDEHILKSVDYAITEGYPPCVIEALMWHDFGKIYCHIIDENGRMSYIGHPEKSAEIYKENAEEFSDKVYDLIKLHGTVISKKMINKYGYGFCKDLYDMKTADRFTHSEIAKTSEKNISESTKELINLQEAHRKELIAARLQSDYDHLADLGYEVVGVFLQGSQNYGLDVYNEGYKSDIDTKAIVLPSVENIINNEKPISTTLVHPNNEHLDVKDIRVMFDTIKKQNINFVEILFTAYKKINPKYIKYMAELFKNKEKLAFADTRQLLNCIVGMSEQKYVALKHPYPTIADKIEKFGYDPKQLHHIVRMNEFIKHIQNGMSFGRALLTHDDREELLRIKLGYLSLDAAEEIAKRCADETYQIKEKMNNENEYIVDVETQSIYKEVKESILKDWFREQLNCTEENENVGFSQRKETDSKERAYM